jgi:hypothetical protein
VVFSLDSPQPFCYTSLINSGEEGKIEIADRVARVFTDFLLFEIGVF